MNLLFGVVVLALFVFLVSLVPADFTRGAHDPREDARYWIRYGFH